VVVDVLDSSPRAEKGDHGQHPAVNFAGFGQLPLAHDATDVLLNGASVTQSR
jgi:hypothetical protein